MNWGYKIMFVYIIFIAGILFLVFKSSSQKVDLVNENYYEQELVFQQKIDEAERAQSLSRPLSYEVNNKDLVIDFPPEMKGIKLDAQVLLYYPADETRDKTFHLSTDSASLVINFPKGDEGMYEIKMNWNAKNVAYYSEYKFMIR